MRQDLGHPGTLLVATDGSPGARLAADVASSLASSTGGELHLVHAWPRTLVYGLQAPRPEGLDGSPEEVAEALLAAEVDRLTAAGTVVAGMHLRPGHPSDVLLALATELDARLLVVGRRGAGGMSRVLIGSTSQTVAARAGCAVLLVPPTASPRPPEHILVGDDGSSESLHAMRYAAVLATVAGVSLDACRVIEDRRLGRTPGEITELDDVVAGSTEDLRARVRDALGTAARLERGGVQVLLGEAAEALDNRQRADRGVWLVMGRHGASSSRSPFGSVSLRLARTAVGPVVLVPASAHPLATRRAAAAGHAAAR